MYTPPTPLCHQKFLKRSSAVQPVQTDGDGAGAGAAGAAGAAAGAACSQHSPGTQGPTAPSLPMVPIAPIAGPGSHGPIAPCGSHRSRRRCCGLHRSSHGPGRVLRRRCSRRAGFVSGGAGGTGSGYQGGIAAAAVGETRSHHPVTPVNPARRNGMNCGAFLRHF